MHEVLLQQAIAGDRRSIGRCISIIENQSEGYEYLLRSVKHHKHVPVIGITGAPGAGKSSLADALIGEILKEEKSVAVVCIDPSSAFHHGALLGDRVRMNTWFNHDKVFIRSFATRGALGGLNACILEIILLLSACSFDYIIVETVGVGQSETDIAALADVSVVVLVPEGGDEMQTMKAGLMEIADIFVVNKSDRPGADMLVKNLSQMTGPAFSRHTEPVPVIKTIAPEKSGVNELHRTILRLINNQSHTEKRTDLLVNRAWHLIRERRMKNLSHEKLKEELIKAQQTPSFSLYQFINNFVSF